MQKIADKLPLFNFPKIWNKSHIQLNLYTSHSSLKRSIKLYLSTVMPLQSITVIHTVMIVIHFYNYRSHFPRPFMYYYISSRRDGWCFILGVLTTCYSSITLLHNICINVCSLFGGSRKTTFTRLCFSSYFLYYI